jgi:hypothetical protein
MLTRMTDAVKLAFIYLLVVLLWAAAPALAQTRTQLNNQNNTTINSNGREAITGPVLNSMLGQIITGAGIVGDTNAWTGTNSYSINPTLSNCFGFPFSSGSAPFACSMTIGPSELAPGAAASNIGTLGGVLSGTLPSPSFAPYAASGNGATNSATPNQRSGHVANVVDDFGAKGNTVTISGTCTIAASSTALHCPGATFTSADVGKYILVHGPAASGAALTTTIAAFVDGQDVTLTVAAATSVPQSGLYALTVTISGVSASYAPLDTVYLTANQGTTTTQAELLINTTQVSAAAASVNGSGCTNGTYTVTGTTGRGTLFTANITVASNVVTSVNSFTAGVYLINPTTLTAEPVTGVTGCSAQPQLALTMAPLTWFFQNAGLFGGTLPTSFTQASTSGTGAGAIWSPSNWVQNGAYTVYGSDDTANVAAAISAAEAYNGCVYFPHGGYWLASSAASIVLKNVCIVGDGAQQFEQPYTAAGSVLLISNTTTSQFLLEPGVNFHGMAVYYPAQDSSLPTPVTFPALFEGGPSSTTLAANDNIYNDVFINPYQLLYVSATDAAIGRDFFHNNLLYCVNKCLYLLNGAPDVISFDSTNTVTVGAFPDGLYSPGAYLATYTNANGEFIHIDTSSGTYNSVDGLSLDGLLVHGYEYGVRIVGTNTLLDVSHLTGKFDGVLTAYSVEGSACWSTTNAVGGWVYAVDTLAPYNINPNAVNIISNCASANKVSFSGFNINYAMGHGYYVAGSGVNKVNIQGGLTQAWGQSTNVLTYSGVYNFAPSGNVNVNGMYADAIQVAGHANDCISNGSNGSMNITGNFLDSCFQVGFFNGTGVNTLSGNQSTNSSFSGPVNDQTGGGFYDMPTNQWDKPALPTLTSGWGTSPGAALTTWSTNNKGSVTLGGSPASTLVMTFGLGAGGSGGVQAHPPNCTATDTTAGAALPVSAPPTTTSVTFADAAPVAGHVVTYACQF